MIDVQILEDGSALTDCFSVSSQASASHLNLRLTVSGGHISRGHMNIPTCQAEDFVIA